MLDFRFWTRLLCCIGMCGTAVPVNAEVSLRYAEGFRVDYFDGYKVVAVVVPGSEAGETLQYVLVQRGRKPPDGYEGVPRIRIPVRSLITTSTTHLPHIEKLDEIQCLVAVDNVKFVNSKAVRQRFAAGKIAEVGRGRSIDIERVLVLRPDFVMIDAPSQDNAYHSLQQAGIAAVVNAAYAEPTLLGRVEWLKFMGAFFNKENLAAAQFDSIAARYNALKSLTANVQLPRETHRVRGIPVAGNLVYVRRQDHIRRNCSRTRARITCGGTMNRGGACRWISKRSTKRRTMPKSGSP